MKNTVLAVTLLSLLFSCQDPQDSKEKTKESTPVLTAGIPETITFPSLDSLPITANLYANADSAPVIILCHQARFNKFEYTKIAETFHKKGYTCLAIDQRSGGGLVETFNETNLKAKELGKPVDFLDAEQDIIAAVNFMSAKYRKKVILWGSSYSSTLALFIALENKNVEAVISFSPGDYFIAEKGSLKEKLAGLTVPAFVTSSKEEAADLTAMLEKVKDNKSITQFIPASEGAHGSRALWKTFEHNEEYWTAINAFLEGLKKGE